MALKDITKQAVEEALSEYDELGREAFLDKYGFGFSAPLATPRCATRTGSIGVVSSYNINTYKGRIYSFAEKRPIPFELMSEARDRRTVGLITNSQHLNGQNRDDPNAVISLSAYKLVSSTGSLKRLHVVGARAAI